MKKLTLLFALLISSNSFADTKLPVIVEDMEVNEIICGDTIAIKDHMAQMGFIIRQLTGSVNSIIEGQSTDELRAEVMLKAQTLRLHLTAVFPKTPDKIKDIKPGDLQGSKLIFQRYILILMEKTVDLEEALLTKPQSLEAEKAQSVKIANIILEIDEIVQSAHNLFRE